MSIHEGVNGAADAAHASAVAGAVASDGTSPAVGERRAFSRRLARIYGTYTLSFALFVLALGALERAGLPRQTIGYVFLGATILLYAGIGIVSRTNDAAEYFVAARRVPALYNGMATGADWMSAASFIGLAGGLYHQGYGGLAFIMGWTGGYVLVALFLAPYLRKFGQYTIPDFIGARYGGHITRIIAAVITVAVSFTYVVAQIYGVGLITTWLTGVDFTVGIFLGLAGVIVCSFLGGMKAVTWTQVAQYIILIVAYLLPVMWLSMKQTGVPVPQLVYGHQLAQVTQIEERLIADPRERQVREIFRSQAQVAAQKLSDVPHAWAQGRMLLDTQLQQAHSSADPEAIKRAEDELARYPTTEAQARARWQAEREIARRAEPLLRHGEPYPGKDEQAHDRSRRNFLALMLCLMLGTAALPHVLVRYYTTPTVREARRSVTWSLLFIVLLYVTAPALAVLVKYAIYHDLVGTAFGSLPDWVQAWARVDPSLLSVSDVNGDGVVQLAEVDLGQDLVVLAMPQIAGLPHVVSCLVAAGGLAAALSTADGLLLAITNALSHDLYHKVFAPQAPVSRQVLLSKMLLVLVAVAAAFVASQRPSDILDLVSAAFSLAAAGFFPALVLGVFWKRATGLGAALGMCTGFGLSFFYMARTLPWLREIFGVTQPLSESLWWDIQPYSAAVFGVPAGFAVIVLVSFLTPRPSAQTQALVESLRYPVLPKGR